MLYAAYGSNLHPLRLTKRISSAELAGMSFLPDWSLHFHKRGDDGSGKGNILSGGDGVHVAIFEISADDKLILDGIEGVGYSAATLAVPEFGDCVCYVASESYIDVALGPYDWYKELVLIGAQTHGFPGDYVSRINTIMACQDPDLTRRQKQWETVQDLKSMGSTLHED
jgi:gamma-glutamylcyclotransferase